MVEHVQDATELTQSREAGDRDRGYHHHHHTSHLACEVATYVVSES